MKDMIQVAAASPVVEVPGRWRRWRWRTGVALLVAAFLAQAVSAARAWSACNDEHKHLATGWVLLRDGVCCLGVDNGPATAWNALPFLALDVREDARVRSPDLTPWDAGRLLLFGSRDPDKLLFAGRLAAIALGMVLVVTVAVVGRALGGDWAGLGAAALVVGDPTVLAHSTVVGTDGPLATAVVLFVAAALAFQRRPSARTGALAGVALGAAVLAKYSGLLLAPALVVVVAVSWRRGRGPLARGLAAAAGAAALVIWAGYGFHVSAEPLFFRAPGFAEGIGASARLAREGWSPAFFMGEVGTSWWSYFPVAIALKTPIPILAAWFLALPGGWLALRRRALAPLAPAALAIAFLTMAMTSHLDIGVRHVLPVFPLLAISSAALWPRPAAGWARLALGVSAAALGLWLAADAVRTHPGQLSFFNAFAGGSRGGIRYLADSNLDWGQDLKALKRWMDERGERELILAYVGEDDPGFYGITYQPAPVMFHVPRINHVVTGRRQLFAVSTNNLQLHPELYGWLVRSREPVAIPAPSIWVYDFTDDPEAHHELARVYAKVGGEVFAAAEMAKAAEPEAIRR